MTLASLRTYLLSTTLMSVASFCPIRLLGDLNLVISFPILVSRILFSKDGRDGVSLTTQVFHLLIFVSRYLDIFLLSRNYSQSQYDGTPLTWNQWFLFWYTPTIKAYVLLISIGVILAVAYRAIIEHATNKERAPCKGKAIKFFKTFAVYILATLCLAYRFNYLGRSLSSPDFGPMDVMKIHQGQWLEILWSFSQFLAAVGEIPQYQKYYDYLKGRKSHDWWLMSSLFATANFRHFYIPHWFIRYQLEGLFDPIALFSAIVHVFIFWIFFAMCNTWIKNTTRSPPTIDEETPMVEGEKEAAALDVKH